MTVFLPKVTQVRCDLFGEELHVLHRELSRQRAERQHRMQVADAVELEVLTQLFAHGRSASSDDTARINEFAIRRRTHSMDHAEVTRILDERFHAADVDAARKAQLLDG